MTLSDPASKLIHENQVNILFSCYPKVENANMYLLKHETNKNN